MCPRVSFQYKQNIKNKIIESAIITFSKYGYDKSRMDDIAITANLSKGTIYLYFKNKEELFNAISERNTNELKNQITKLFDNKDDLITCIENFYEDFDDQGYRMFFEIIAESSRNTNLKQLLHQERRKILDIITDYLNTQKNKGFLRKDIEITEIAYGFVSLYDGLKINKVLGIAENQNRKTWIRTVKVIFTGIS
ncbi:MAG: yfiR 2 [Nitrososphaeraceae archaeon]|nr:yfiR 2 [Nitrososphaeraceae archaeon]